MPAPDADLREFTIAEHALAIRSPYRPRYGAYLLRSKRLNAFAFLSPLRQQHSVCVPRAGGGLRSRLGVVAAKSLDQSLDRERGLREGRTPMSSDSVGFNRFPAMAALFRKWSTLARPFPSVHPDAPRVLSAVVHDLKDAGRHYYGYEPVVRVDRLEDRWCIDVARPGITHDVRSLRSLAGDYDWKLGDLAPNLAFEFRIEGQRFPEFCQGRPFSRTRFAVEYPTQELREAVFKIENSLRERFGTEPFLRVCGRPHCIDVHITLDAKDKGECLDALLDETRRSIRRHHSHLDIQLFPEFRQPPYIGREQTQPRVPGPDLSLEDLSFLLSRLK